MTIAALPMYDLAHLQSANDALWAAIATRLQAAGVAGTPATLTRGPSLDEIWTDPRLLVAQTCGYPLMTLLRDRVRLLATPCYGAQGCDGPDYRSAIIVRRDDPSVTLADLRGGRCAVNAWSSNSGMNLLRAALAPLAGGGTFFRSVLTTGAHAASVEAVASAAADVAAIDCVTWAHLQRLQPAATRSLRVLDWTAPSPGLPWITSLQTPASTLAALRQAMDEVMGDPALEEVRATLLLRGFADLAPGRYESILALERSAVESGYPTLR